MGYSTRTIKDWRMQVRRALSVDWDAKDPVLLEGEIGWEMDTNKIKIGNGVNSWSNLDYINGGNGGGGANTVTDYRSEYESDDYIYSGFLLNTIPIIRRTRESVIEVADNVTDLETDWGNRLTLTYI